jgi:hypothetical protein
MNNNLRSIKFFQKLTSRARLKKWLVKQALTADLPLPGS